MAAGREKVENNNIYPGHGACELCGEVDPCYACVSVPPVDHLEVWFYEKKSQHLGKKVPMREERKDEEQRVDG